MISHARMPVLVFAAVVAAMLAACNPRASAPNAAVPAPAASGVTPSTSRMPEGSGCAGDVARFRAVLANDAEVGHLTQSVFARATADLDKATQACVAGRDGDARAQVAATRRRYGYP
ncbi:hypothetical protein [uncultured Enterovirga sp.]|uniref:hypothetical protein n=1 Tax=uncultured Enterovirga sp. TaxID=2026352 RepID=UPI0035CC9A07